MTNPKTLVALLALSLAPGCGVSHDPTIEEVPAVVDPSIPAVGPTPASAEVRPTVVQASPLERCLAGHGDLVEIASVDNDDQHDHGALLTFGISPDGIIAAAGEDGTLKFWTLDAHLVGTVNGSALISYGAEVGGSPITDVAFMGEMAVVGDVRGLVQQMGADGTFLVLGGTTPDVPIDAVAFDNATGRFAHAQHGDVVPVAVHDVDGSSPAVEITATLDVVRDLAFAPAGQLYVAGAMGGAAAIEVRDATDPSAVVRNIALSGAAPVVEIALSREGGVVAGVASDFLYLVRGETVLAIPAVEHAPTSVALTRRGDFAFSIGADGALVVRSGVDGSEIARTPVVRPITVRVDATDSLILVGGQDAIIHAFSCVGG